MADQKRQAGLAYKESVRMQSEQIELPEGRSPELRTHDRSQNGREGD